MKLRNKKTGRVFDAIVREKSDYDEKYSIIVCNLKDYRGGGMLDSILGEYDSLAELNEEWEDYTPKEPLIKDEKIRKAVRAWADASGIEKVLSYGGTFWLGFRSTNTESVWKFECNYADASDFEDKEFSIEELCGEEE